MKHIRNFLGLIGVVVGSFGTHAVADEPPSAAKMAAVEIAPNEAVSLASNKNWQNVPPALAGAQVFEKAALTKRELKFKATQPGLVLIAASWNYEGGGWEDTINVHRPLLADLMEAGWTPIATMNFRGRDEHVVFRRAAKAGETFDIHTRNKTAPFLLTVAEKDADAVAALPPLVPPERRTLLKHDPVHPFDKLGIKNTEVALFRTCESPNTREAGIRGMLLREIVRQASSIAARNELCLPTRDTSVRERLGQEAGATNFPLDMLVVVQSTYDVEAALFQRRGANWEPIWDNTLTFPRDHFFDRLVAKMELLSRTEFPEALKRAGYPARPPVAVRDASDLPASALRITQELTIPGQFIIVRDLHHEILTGGESPRLVAALARSYAMLGVLTEQLWSPAHKTFKARALLYAERAVARWPKQPIALQSRAFARALVGLHALALSSLAVANGLESPEAPAWVAAIDAYCRFDAEALAKLAENESELPLVRLLELLTAEASGSDREIVRTSTALLELEPGCFRGIDGAALVRQLGYKRMTAQRSQMAGRQFMLAQLARIENLPRPVAELLGPWRSGKNDGQETEDAAANETTVRLQAIKLLRDAGLDNNDEAEPSWRVLAQLLEEMNFVIAWRQIDEVANWLGMPPAGCDACVQAIWPLVEHHPYANFIASYKADKAASDLALREMINKFDVARIQYIEQPMIVRLGNFDAAFKQKFYSSGYAHEDLIASDLPRDIRSSSDPMTQIPYLAVVSPHMPFAVAQQIVHGGADVRTKSAELEKRYPKSAQVQAALGKFLAGEKRWDDAIRCYNTALELDPAQATFEALAAVYDKRGDEANWLATLEKYLQTEDFGLGHARVRVNIANHYIEKREWQTARGYAVAAAQTWAGWAMLKAAECAEAQQDWEAAEMWYRNTSTRYADSLLYWFKFCKRTGKGDAAAAEKLVMEALDRGDTKPFGGYGIPLTYMLLRRDADAAKAIEASFKKSGQIGEGVCTAVWLDIVNNTDLRDRVLKVIPKTVEKSDSALVRAYILFAAMMRDTVAGNAATIDFDKLDEHIAEIPLEQRPWFLFVAGKFLDRHNHADRALKYWKDSMQSIQFEDNGRTLAAAELVAHGVPIEEFKEAALVLPEKEKPKN